MKNHTSIGIGFLIPRKTYYKQLASLIDEALRQDLRVVCIHDLSEPLSSSKAYDRPTFEDAPRFRYGTPQRAEINALAEITKVVDQAKLNILVTLGFRTEHTALRSALDRISSFQAWAVVQHSADDLIEPIPLSGADFVFLYSEQWREWLLSHFKRKGGDMFGQQRLNQKIHCLGAPQIDQYDFIDPDKVRKEWGIPVGKKVVVVLPFPFGSSLDRFWSKRIFGETRTWLALLTALVTLRPRWIRQALRGSNNKNVMASIRAFCDKNEAWLLIKSRQKDPIPSYARSFADQILVDEGFYPATILKCFAIADLCIHFNSTAVIEAAASGVPSLNISPDARDYLDLRSPILRDVYKSLHKLLNSSKVCVSLSIPEAIQKLPTFHLDQFHPKTEEYRLFQEAYVGPMDRQSAGRIIHAMIK